MTVAGTTQGVTVLADIDLAVIEKHKTLMHPVHVLHYLAGTSTNNVKQLAVTCLNATSEEVSGQYAPFTLGQNERDASYMLEYFTDRHGFATS